MKSKILVLLSLIVFAFLAEAQAVSNGVMYLKELRKPT